MNAPPPVIGPPQFSGHGGPPPRIAEGRQPWAWVLMSLLFAGLIGLALASYFGSLPAEKDTAPTEKFSKEAGELQYWVAIKTLAPSLDTTGKGGSRQQIRSIADRLEPQVAKSPEAARLYAAARFESGEPITDRLEILERSKRLGDRSFAEIYLEEPLTRDEARALSAKLDDHGFVTVLAKVHALERTGDQDARKRLLPLGTWLGIATVVGAVMLVGGLGLVLWLVYAVARSRKKLVPHGFPRPCLTPLDGDRGAARMVLFLLIFVFVGGLFVPLATRGLDDATGGAVASVAVAIVFFASLRLRIFGRATSFREVVGETTGLGKLVGWGVVGWMAMVPVVLLLSLASQALTRFLPEPTHPINDLLPNAGPWQAAMLFLAAAILAPLMEETAFRGILLPAVSRALGSVFFGIVISSFLFASIHPQGIAGWPPLMGIGAVCAALTYQTRSLVPAMVVHAIHNGLIVTVSLLILR